MNRFHPLSALRRMTTLSPLPGGLLLSLLLVACGETSVPTAPSTPVPESPPADMDAYMTALPSWQAFAPMLADFEGPVPGTSPSTREEMVNGLNYTCTETPHSITKTPEKIVTLNPDVEILWPGSLLQGDGYVGGIGSLAELPIRQRAPVTLSLDILSGDNTRTVIDPDLASVSEAIGDLVETASNAGHTAGSKIFYNQVDYHSLAQASMKAGFSASYSGATIQASLEASVRADKSTVMAVYTHQMFTVSMVLPQSPGDVFSDELTEELLQAQVDFGRIGPDNLPVYVSSIVYGQTVVFSMTAEATEADIKAALSISAGTVGGELSTDQKALLATSEINLVAIGGDAAQAAAVIRSGDFASYFDEQADLTTARPISYTVRNLADNVLAQVSETTEYTLTQCSEPEPTGAIYLVEMVDVRWVERANVLCAPWPAQVLASSKFYVEDASAVNTLVDNLGGGALTAGGGAQQYNSAPAEVRLHFDGRDSVRLYGDVWTIYPTHFSWNPGITFTGTMNTGTFGTSRWSSGPLACHRFAIRYRVTYQGPLYD